MLNYDSDALNTQHMSFSQSYPLHSLDQPAGMATEGDDIDHCPSVDVTLALRPEVDKTPVSVCVCVSVRWEEGRLGVRPNLMWYRLSKSKSTLAVCIPITLH